MDDARPRRQLALRVAGFTVGPVLSLLSPLVLMPAVARVSGPAGWSSIGAAQAIGSMLATVTLFGWAASGPAKFAQLRSEAERRDLYRSSVRSRTLLLLAGLVPSSGAALALAAPEWRVTAVLIVLASATVGLSPSWYCVALGKPALLFRYEAAPRMAATVGSLVAVAVFRQVWLYPVISVLVVCAGLWALDRTQFRGRPSPWPRGQVLSSLREQLPVASMSLVSAVYVAAPVPLAVLILPTTAAAGFASAQKLYAYSSFTILALANGMQSWVLAQSGAARAHRVKRSAQLHILLGAAGVAGFAVLGSPVSALLFGADVRADAWTCAAFGLSFLFVSLSTPLMRNVVIPAGRARVGLRATVAAAGVGLPIMALLGRALDAPGVALGLAACEIIVAAVVTWSSLRILRRLAHVGTSTEPAAPSS